MFFVNFLLYVVDVKPTSVLYFALQEVNKIAKTINNTFFMSKKLRHMFKSQTFIVFVYFVNIFNFEYKNIKIIKICIKITIRPI